MVTIFIVGPTCTGKTSLAIELAKKLKDKIDVEIISADSRQIYKYLTVGTAKPKGTWRRTTGSNFGNGNWKFFVDSNGYSVAYHLVDFLDPSETFSAGDFVRLTNDIVNQLIQENKLPVIVGGTGLYIWSYLYGLCPLPKRNENIRAKLKTEESKYGSGYLHKKLSTIDPKAANKIHPNNLQRIIRALEVYYLTGYPISYWWNKKISLKSSMNHFKGSTPHIIIGLYQPREILYNRINQRVCKMLQNGMIEETQKLLQGEYGKVYDENCPGMQSIGYKHVVSYLKKQISFDDMKLRIQQDTRNYAKRQFTWFKAPRIKSSSIFPFNIKEKLHVWFDTSQIKLTEIAEFIEKEWKKSLSSE